MYLFLKDKLRLLKQKHAVASNFFLKEMAAGEPNPPIYIYIICTRLRELDFCLQ